MESKPAAVSLRVKCNGHSLPFEFPGDNKIFDFKCHMLRAWPLKWPRARVPTDMRFIFLGKELKDEDNMEEIRKRASTAEPTVHLVVRERNIASPGSTPQTTPTVHYAGSPVKVREGPLIPKPPGMDDDDSDERENDENQPEEEELEAAAHFHAVTVSEREMSEFRLIFDKKKGADGLITVSTVRMVLQSYWRFIHREGFEPNPGPFPEERLSSLCRKIKAEDDKLTLDQFLTVFYLFDNAAAEEPCIHGERERVRIATSQLHSVLQPSHEFYHDKFEELFALVCGQDENQQHLTCKEMELLYYMYSCFVLDKVRESELVAKVQAIVRMRIQSSKYTKMVEAARKVQNAWRLRMFTADRHNHERISEFLNTLLHGTPKLGGPRI